jgi:hypothetical protein
MEVRGRYTGKPVQCGAFKAAIPEFVKRASAAGISSFILSIRGFDFS